MHYLSHETVDSKNGIIIDVVATTGNVHDSQPYINRIDYVEKNLGLKIQAACADSGYDTNLINRTTNTVTKKYRCPKTVCKGCPLRNQCIGEKGTDKRIMKKMAPKHTPMFCFSGKYGMKAVLRGKKQDTI